jgi:ATP/maltotriose-dependent transcriptional regulator MalT
MRTRPPAAKVSRPRLIDLKPRARLHQRLDALRRAHAVPWIAAPAGSGKTALIVGYVEQRRIPAIWYRVDEGDRDAEALFFHLRVAAERFERSRRAGVELPSFSPRAELGPFSRRFFEDLFARLPAGALLVLDDYQLAPEDSTWQSAIEKGISCIPPGMNILVASRRSPPPALARPCVHGDLGLLEAADLFLTERETIALGECRPVSRHQSRRTRADLREIHAMTGGWVAGVSLLLRQDRRNDAPILSAGAEVQPIFDYFASSVFSELTDDAQRLLLHTACLSRFSDKQAESLSAVTGARAVLMSLY